MPDRPYVLCLMTSSIDGRLHPSRYTDSPDGGVEDWNGVYATLHDGLAADGWMVGRVTMAEMAKGEPRPTQPASPPPRPLFRAPDAASPYAIAPDAEAQLHFQSDGVGGDDVIVLLGSEVADTHLAELIAAGVSYVVAEEARPDLATALATLKQAFGIERLALEGGGGLNGAMIEAGLVDELHVLVVPALDGDDGRQGIVIAGDGGLKGKTALSLVGSETRDHGTVLLRYRFV